MFTIDHDRTLLPNSGNFEPDLEFPPDEVTRLVELVRAGRIIAILAWVDRLMLAQPQFQPIAESIEVLCKSLNIRGLTELVDSLQNTSLDQQGNKGRMTQRYGQ